VLEQHHCVKIEALHVPFDPHLHHAILQQPADNHPANTVIMVTQDGYQLHDRVVRPSQVIVSTNSTE
jgi:molecular chaperone GrpE